MGQQKNRNSRYKGTPKRRFYGTERLDWGKIFMIESGDNMSSTSKNPIEWYCIKLLHKITIDGDIPKDKIEKCYHDANTFFEESILLVQASSFDEAYNSAENKAKNDNDIYENKYGQIVKREFFKSIDCFHLFDSPESGSEIYSAFFRKGQGEDEKILLDQRYHYCVGDELHPLRHK